MPTSPPSEAPTYVDSRDDDSEAMGAYGHSQIIYRVVPILQKVCYFGRAKLVLVTIFCLNEDEEGIALMTHDFLTVPSLPARVFSNALLC